MNKPLLQFLNSIDKMTCKRQLRWLFLMLIPFMLFFTFHMFTPLSIAGAAHPLMANAYILQTIYLSENHIKATNMIASSSIQNIIEKYLAYINIFSGFALQQSKAPLPVDAVPLNSAFLFNSRILSTPNQYQTVSQQSMWFSPNLTDPQNLSPPLKNVYGRYLRMEHHIRALLQQPINSAIASISVLFATPNESLFFQFPSKYDSDFVQLNTSVEDTFYFNVVQAYDNLSPSSFAVVKEQPILNKSFLVICKPSQVNGSLFIPCIQLDISLIAKQILSQTNLTGIDSTKTFLIPNINTSLNQSLQVVAEFQNGTKILTHNKALLNLSSTGISTKDFALRQSAPQEQLLIMRTRSYTSYISSVDSYNGLTSTSILRLYTQSPLQFTSKIRTVNFQSNIINILMPIGILILIGSVVSALVLKYLLDSLDEELQQLDNRCKFIVEGDIDIQICEHKGTEDISKVYDQVRTINKLHRYSVSSYFTGHYAQKLLKYNQALQFLTHLHYDIGNALENMGEASVFLEQWDKANDYFNKSINIGLRELKQTYNLIMDDVLALKKLDHSLPHRYKQLQIVLIRRMFRLLYVQVKYIEHRLTFTKVDLLEQNQEQLKKKIDKMVKQCLQNLRLLKICLFPDYSSSSEGILTLLTEAKQLANQKRFDQAKRMLQIADRYYKVYDEQYPNMTNKLKEKGSKLRLFHKRNKLTPHSRMPPEIIKIFKCLYQARIIGASTQSVDKLNKIVYLLTQALKTGLFFLSFGYMAAIQLRKLLISLKINPEKYESTQIFKQAAPFKTLHYGEVTKEDEPQLLKYYTQNSQGLEREFVFLFDCAKDSTKRDEKYQKERVNYIFDRLIKPSDRLSIIKYNLKGGLKVECNLTLKQSNEEMLRKEINSSSDPGKVSFKHIIEVLYKTVNRIKALQCEKVVVIFFKGINYYCHLMKLKYKKKLHFQKDGSSECDEELTSDFGLYVIEALSAEGLRNCKLIIFCARKDSIQEFRTFFGLEDINRQLWEKDKSKNNLVYLIQEKNKSDIDRILMLKTQDPPDNHIFIL